MTDFDYRDLAAGYESDAGFRFYTGLVKVLKMAVILGVIVWFVLEFSVFSS